MFDPITDHKIDNCKTIKNYSSLKNYKGYFDGILVLVSHTSIKNKDLFILSDCSKKGIFFDLKILSNKKVILNCDFRIYL